MRTTTPGLQSAAPVDTPRAAQYDSGMWKVNSGVPRTVRHAGDRAPISAVSVAFAATCVALCGCADGAPSPGSPVAPPKLDGIAPSHVGGRETARRLV